MGCSPRFWVVRLPLLVMHALLPIEGENKVLTSVAVSANFRRFFRSASLGRA